MAPASPETAITLPQANVRFTINAGERVEAVKRPVLEVVCKGRPTAGYIPVTLLG